MGIKRLWLLLLLAGCVQPILQTPTIPPMGETPTASPSLTSSPSPTITNTPQPTWTAYQVDMFYPPTERAVFDPKNAHQDCFITFFDLTLEPGHIGVWRRDNGQYIICEAHIASEGNQP